VRSASAIPGLGRPAIPFPGLPTGLRSNFLALFVIHVTMRETGKKLLPLVLLLLLLPAGQAQAFFCLLKEQGKHRYRPRMPMSSFPARRPATAPLPPPVEEPSVNGYLGRSAPRAAPEPTPPRWRPEK